MGEKLMFMLAFLKPYLAKLGAVAALLMMIGSIWLYVERLRADVRADVARIGADNALCANTQMMAAATENSKAQAVINNQRINLDAAQAAYGAAATAAQTAAAAGIATIQVQAAQTGEDGPVPLVLVNAVASLRGAP